MYALFPFNLIFFNVVIKLSEKIEKEGKNLPDMLTCYELKLSQQDRGTHGWWSPYIQNSCC